jgi:hypothetical protein
MISAEGEKVKFKSTPTKAEVTLGLRKYGGYLTQINEGR